MKHPPLQWNGSRFKREGAFFSCYRTVNRDALFRPQSTDWKLIQLTFESLLGRLEGSFGRSGKVLGLSGGFL